MKAEENISQNLLKRVLVIKGYNDCSKSCPNPECEGKVQPTMNPHVGECNECYQKFRWSNLID